MPDTCGNCKHSQIKKNGNGVVDFNARICKGAPPSVLIVPGPGGQPTFASAFPTVSVNEHCGAHKPMDAAQALEAKTAGATQN